MTLKIEGNINRNDTATTTVVTVGTTPVTILAADDNRIRFSVTLMPGTFDVDVAIRLYPAAYDTTFQGYDVLSRRFQGNDNAFRPHMNIDANNMYTGEVSAMTLTGTVDLLVTTL